MAEKACHVFGSTTQVGLTQALGPKSSLSFGFSSSETHRGPSTPVGTASAGLASASSTGALTDPAAWPASASTNTPLARRLQQRSEEHTSELQSLMRITYAVIC